jgi:hypothetical protein
VLAEEGCFSFHLPSIITPNSMNLISVVSLLKMSLSLSLSLSLFLSPTPLPTHYHSNPNPAVIPWSYKGKKRVQNPLRQLSVSPLHSSPSPTPSFFRKMLNLVIPFKHIEGRPSKLNETASSSAQKQSCVVPHDLPVNESHEVINSLQSI